MIQATWQKKARHEIHGAQLMLVTGPGIYAARFILAENR